MTTLQRRLFFFLGVALALFALLFVLDWSWKGLIVLLVLLLIVLGAYIKPLYNLVVHPPLHTPEYQPSHSQEEEYSPYQEGLKEHPVLYRRPYNVVYVPSSETSGQPKEESHSEFEPTSQYPQMLQ